MEMRLHSLIDTKLLLKKLLSRGSPAIDLLSKWFRKNDESEENAPSSGGGNADGR
jgi:hypothetical protein